MVRIHVHMNVYGQIKDGEEPHEYHHDRRRPSGLAGRRSMSGIRYGSRGRHDEVRSLNVAGGVVRGSGVSFGHVEKPYPY